MGLALAEIRINKANDLLYSTKARILLASHQVPSSLVTFRWIYGALRKKAISRKHPEW